MELVTHRACLDDEDYSGGRKRVELEGSLRRSHVNEINRIVSAALLTNRGRTFLHSLVSSSSSFLQYFLSSSPGQEVTVVLSQFERGSAR